MGVAATLLLSGVDPIGTPWLRAGQFERELWEATIMRAAEITKG